MHHSDPARLQPPASGMRRLTLDLAVDPADAAAVARSLGLRGKGSALRMIWHDTPDTSLARRGRLLAEQRLARAVTWRLERWWPDPDDPASLAPGAEAALLAESDDAASLVHELQASLVPVAAFEGHARSAALAGGASHATLLTGALRAVAGERASARLRLEGDAADVMTQATALGRTLRVAVPARPLAIEAYATAHHAIAPRRTGAPVLPGEIATGDAFALIVGHLVEVILLHAPQAVRAEEIEAVHQMRVASRRLRSAFQLFRGALESPEIAQAEAALKVLGKLLGPARDWDVFLGETLHTLAAALPDEAAVPRLVRRGRQQREAAYQALRGHLEGPAFRQFGLAYASLVGSRPWEPVPPAEPVADPVAWDGGEGRTEFGSAVAGANGSAAAAPSPDAAPSGDALRTHARVALDKRLKRLLAPGRHIKRLPPEDLHAIRLDAKRLRYVAEFCAPLFPGGEPRRYLRRLARLQESLGYLNDTSVAAGLLAEIGQSNSFAGGLVRGYAAAGMTDRRDDLGRAWRKLRRASPFWRQA